MTKRVDFNQFFGWFRSVEEIEKDWRQRQRSSDYRHPHLNAVRKATSPFLEEFSFLRFESPSSRMLIQKSDQDLLIQQLSDGEKIALGMIGDIARRLAIANPGLEDPLQGEGIVMIDEIELHLHPKWQRGLLPHLLETFPNCQFIVTTHSPQVISDVQPHQIIHLRLPSKAFTQFIKGLI